MMSYKCRPNVAGGGSFKLAGLLMFDSVMFRKGRETYFAGFRI